MTSIDVAAAEIGKALISKPGRDFAGLYYLVVVVLCIADRSSFTNLLSEIIYKFTVRITYFLFFKHSVNTPGPMAV